MIKRITLVADLKLSGRPFRPFQVLGPTKDKLWIPSFLVFSHRFQFLLVNNISP